MKVFIPLKIIQIRQKLGMFSEKKAFDFKKKNYKPSNLASYIFLNSKVSK